NTDIINSKAAALQAVIVEGYCDNRGTDTYNLALGQRRADSVKSYLIKAGIPSSMVQAVSKGKTDKWASGSNESAYQENRRAHFVALAN
ncbi:MAG: OmpA family protein, partial [Thermodesulfobacteriota bacterium]